MMILKEQLLIVIEKIRSLQEISMQEMELNQEKKASKTREHLD